MDNIVDAIKCWHPGAKVDWGFEAEPGEGDWDKIFRSQRMMKVSKKELLEELAKIEHDQWIEWSKAVQSEVSEDRRSRWKKYWVDYEELSEDVKEQDRVYARRVLDVVEKHTGE